jgi:hypothetical protein
MRRTPVASCLTSPLVAAAIAIAAIAPRPAAADPLTDLTIGSRVGGYGFRNPQAGDRRDAWNDCRMNGIGVFAREDVGRLNVEAGADIYFSESFPMKPLDADAREDRLSGLVTVAAGARVLEIGRFHALAQLGGGVELTHFKMSMPDGETGEASRAMPMGFVGLAAELSIGDRAAIGASLRTNVMGKFEANEACQLSVHPEAAAQGQFFLTYRL